MHYSASYVFTICPPARPLPTVEFRCAANADLIPACLVVTRHPVIGYRFNFCSLISNLRATFPGSQVSRVASWKSDYTAVKFRLREISLIPTYA